MHSRLSVDAMCTFSWPFERDLALWSDLEIRQAGLLSFKIADDPEGKMQRLADAGISASTIICDCFDLADPASWQQTRDAHRKVIDVASRFGGHSIYFTPGRTTGAPWQDNLELFAEAVAPTVEHARENGVIAAIEPSLRTSVSFVNTLRDAIDVADYTGVALIADFGNMWMERDFHKVLKQAMPHVALIQICDVVIGSAGGPSPGRAQINRGELPLRRMMQDVLDAGYEGVFDLEVVTAELSADCDEEEVRRGVRAASDLLAEVGI